MRIHHPSTAPGHEPSPPEPRTHTVGTNAEHDPLWVRDGTEDLGLACGVLACGVPVADLLEQVADGLAARRSPHQTQCPGCQATLADYDRVWTPIRALAATTPPPPRRLRGAGFALGARALPHTRPPGAVAAFGVHQDPGGLTTVAGAVATSIARACAAATPGVHAALTTLTEPSPDTDRPAGQEPAPGRGPSMAVTVAAVYGPNLPELAARVRATIITALRVVTGLTPASVTVRIDDVWPTPTPAPPPPDAARRDAGHHGGPR